MSVSTAARASSLAPFLGSVRVILIGALPLVVEAISPNRVSVSIAVAAVYLVAALAINGLRAVDRPVLIYAVVAILFIALSIGRLETIDHLNAAQRDYGLHKALYVILVTIPLGFAAALLVRFLDDLKPAVIVFLLVGGLLAIATVLTRNSSLLGVGRYPTQGNLIAIAGLLACQAWVLRSLRIRVVWLAVAFIAVLITESRQSVSGLVIGLVATAAYWFVSDRIRKTAVGRLAPTRLWALPALVLGALAAIILIWGALALQPWVPTPTAVHNPVACNCIAGRFVDVISNPGGRNVLLQQGWSLFVAHPIVGAGLGSFVGLTAYPYPHNIELEVGGEMGLVGVIVLLVPLAIAWIRLTGSGMRRGSPAVASGIMIMLVYLVVANLSGDIASERGFWVFGLIGIKLGWKPLVEFPRTTSAAVIRNDNGGTSRAPQRIWVINHYADPPDGLATRTYDLARRWVEKGNPTTLFVSNFNHYHLKPVRKIPWPRLWLDEDLQGVRMVWLRSPGYRNNDWRRVVNMVTFSVLAVTAGVFRSERPDVVIGVSVHPLAGLAGWAVARLRGARFFFEVTDLWPETLIEFGVLPARSPAARTMHSLERFLFRRSERIVMLWRHTDEYVESQGVARERIAWIPHGVELSRYQDLKPYDGVAGKPFRVVYLGGFVSANSLDTILDAAAELKRRGRRDIELLLIGSGQDRGTIMERARRLELDNVQFPDAVPKAEISRAMAMADAFIYGLRDIALYRYGISLNKLTDYLAAGRPIIFFGRSTYDPVAEARAGFSVPPGDPAAIADAIVKLTALSPEERRSMGERGRDYLEGHHNIPVLAERYLDMLGTEPQG